MKLTIFLSLFVNLSFAIDPMDSSGFTKITSRENIFVDMRYNTTNNFTSEKVDGYLANVCYLATPVAKKLIEAAEYLEKKKLGLYIFDCYRPQKGVDHFIRWSSQPDIPEAKKNYYPNLPKEKLFEMGYIAKKSGHSRGSTIDISLYKTDDPSPSPLNMGTPYDFLDERSHTADASISKLAQANRMILKKSLERFGFVNYRKEWWHFTYKPEVYPKTYFNFDVTK